MRPKRESNRRHSTDRSPVGRGVAASRGTSVSVRRLAAQDAWELVHPKCALDRAEDLEEVQAMLAAGEVEVARDELRWLLEGCSDLIAAHRMLGEIALGEGDVRLARAHFGYAYQIGIKAIEAQQQPVPLPHTIPANQAFLESAKALAWCLLELGKRDMARGVLETLLACDPSDALGAKELSRRLEESD